MHHAIEQAANKFLELLHEIMSYVVDGGVFKLIFFFVVENDALFIDEI